MKMRRTMLPYVAAFEKPSMEAYLPGPGTLEVVGEEEQAGELVVRSGAVSFGVEMG